MIGLTGLRLGGVIGGLVAIVAALTWLVATVRDRDRLRAAADAHAACLIDLRGGAKADPDLARCEPEVAAIATAAAAARACDTALGDATGRSDYAIRMTCPTSVKALQADVVTLTAAAADLARQVADARAGLDAAVTRGETRAAAITTRTRHAQAAIAAAPTGADGLVRCAGECLRALAGDSAAPAKP